MTQLDAGGTEVVADDVLLARAYLSRVAEPGCIPVWDLVRQAGPVDAARAIRRGTVPAEVAQATSARRDSADPEADLDAADRHGLRLVGPESDEWPHFAIAALEATGLRRLSSYRSGRERHREGGEPIPPLALWVKGPGDLPQAGVRGVAMVGSRAATAYGRHIAADLSYALAGRGFDVVSGGAFGIDAAAHRGALGADGQTILVSAGGLDRPYPPGNAALFDAVAESGLLVSESPPGAAPQRHRFLTRNWGKNATLRGMKQALIYTRISRTDPKTPKVELQRTALEELAQQRGYRVVGVYTDDGLSAAKAENRPDFDRMIADLPKHPNAVILATEEARLARNGFEKNLLMLSCVQAGITWETLRDGPVDPATASGGFMATIRGAVDSFESQRKSERQRAANAHRRASGKPVPGQRPFGWEIDQMTPVPAEQALIRQGIEMILSGNKPWSVVKAWNASGVKTGRGNNWSTTSVVSVLKRWRNAGWIEFDGEAHSEGLWDGICTKDELEQVRAILDSKTVPPVGWRKPTGLCSGIAKCVCGGPLVITGYKAKRVYRCSTIANPGNKATHEGGSQHVQIKMDTLDRVVTQEIVDTYHRIVWVDSEDPAQNALGELHTALGKIRDQREKLLDLYLSGPLTKAAFTKRDAALLTTANGIETEIATITRRSAHMAMVENARQLLMAHFREGASLASVEAGMLAAFRALPLENQRGLVSATVEINVMPGRTDERIKIRNLVMEHYASIEQ